MTALSISRARRCVLSVLGAALMLGGVPGAASAWSPAARLTTSGTPYAPLAVGSFALPDGSFLLSGYSDYYSLPSGSGNTTGVAGGTFAAPSGPLIAAVAALPDGSSLVEWNNTMVQQRAADGTFVGSPQHLSDNVNALATDATGNATAAGVLSNNGFFLHVYTRAPGDSAFAETPTPVATSDVNSPMTLVGLVVDPDGAAVVTWQVNSTLYQATRAAGASSFGSPVTIASNVVVGASSTLPSLASNPAGRSAVVYFDGSGYSAAIREPGGAFGTPVDFTGPLTPTFANSAVAVAGDGSAATLVRDSAGSPGGCGHVYSLRAYRIAAAGSSWSSAGTFGGTLGDSVSFPTLAGGPGSRIDATWSTDTSASSQQCGNQDSFELDAGTLGGPMTAILSVASPPLAGATTYGNAYAGGFYAKMALNSCGDGALIVGIADSANSDTHDGLFTSTSKSCAPVDPGSGGSPGGPGGGGGSTGGSGSGGGSPGGSGAGGGPTAAQVKALVLSELIPTGKAAKIAALLKKKSYALSFKAPSAGSATIGWYFLPKGAHLAAAAAKPVLIASGKHTFSAPGTATITIKLTAKGQKMLKHARKLKVTAKGLFTRAGASAVVATKAFSLKK